MGIFKSLDVLCQIAFPEAGLGPTPHAGPKEGALKWFQTLSPSFGIFPLTPHHLLFLFAQETQWKS